jgi:hypothetical protein
MRKYEVCVYCRDWCIKRKSEEHGLKISHNGYPYFPLFALLAIFDYHKAQEKYITNVTDSKLIYSHDVYVVNK